jgi:hypothetical protein
MKYSVDSGAIIHVYKPSFINTGSTIQNRRGKTQTHKDSMVIAQTYFYFSKLGGVG